MTHQNDMMNKVRSTVYPPTRNRPDKLSPESGSPVNIKTRAKNSTQKENKKHILSHAKLANSSETLIFSIQHFL